jgi:hypothetical protein
VKKPQEVQEKIAELGTRLVDEGDDLVVIGDAGALWLAQRDFGLIVLAAWMSKEVRTWIGQQANRTAREAGGQLALAIPDLPPYLEVMPGVLKHQRAMTRHDWQNTVAIYRNRRDQAEILCRRLEEAWERLRPLLRDDGTTTAEIMGALEEGTG